MKPLFVNVAIPLSVNDLYTYSVPSRKAPQIKVGIPVLVPFGKRRLNAYVVNLASTVAINHDIKEIIDVLGDQPLFPEEMVPFFKWIAEYYIFPIGQVIKHALPTGLKVHDRIGLVITPIGHQALEKGLVDLKEIPLLKTLIQHTPNLYIPSNKSSDSPSSALIKRLVQKGWVEKVNQLTTAKAKARIISKIDIPSSVANTKTLSKARQKIIDFLVENGKSDLTELKAIGPNAMALARKMDREGQVTISQERMFRDPFGDLITPDRPPSLTPEQLIAIASIKKTIGLKYQTYLLSGVTGSGKTEVYLQLTKYAVSLGLTTLVLVPEIALINQMERRFRARFDNNIAILHSSLSIGQRYDQWEQIASGHLPICIGVRSAIFAPLPRLGLIIVDEEHDPSYKQEDSLRYNARDLAIVRGHQCNATVVLGSATPSIQSYYNVIKKKFIEVPLLNRVHKRPLPEIEIVDLAKDKEITGTRRFITPVLYHAMQAALERNEQILLFLNRRGFANFPICMDCKEALRCKNCDISLTLHKSINGFKCHFCGYSRPAATITCTHCGSSRIRYLGLGTEKLESAVKTLFPGASVARMDRDTTTRKGSLLKILKDIRNGDIQILVGTQMVAKGHDFPNITLVGIICADLSLNFPDFRAGEHTFQLLAQVAGRTGRGNLPGRVILQSYQPDHFSISTAQKQDFRKFYAHEIAFRKAVNYPPYTRMIQIRFLGLDKDRVVNHARLYGDKCRQLKNDRADFNSHLELLGPIEAPLFRIAGQYRYQMILKSKYASLLHQFIHALFCQNLSTRRQNGIRIEIDVDPFSML